ncbi:MAG TPA: DUF2846 domain-containing protein [Chitinophagaceae bacterium]|jgi:hypothetical protein
MKLLLLTFFIAVSLVSAGRSVVNKTKSDDSTFIYIYRSGKLTGSLINWWIYVDDQKICKLSNNRYMQVFVKRGKHIVEAKQAGVTVSKKETQITITAERGKNYFVACNVQMKVLSDKLELLEVTESTGGKQMDGMLLDNCQQPGN